MKAAANDPTFTLRRLLLIRLDRIGDLVLTLPVGESLPGAEVQWWIPQGLSFVTQSARPRRTTREVPRKIRLLQFISLLSDVRKSRFDAAVVFHAPWWVSLLLWLARIPVRAGVKSQWHSFLFLNRAIRQKRSRAEHNELEYNYRLVEAAFRLPENSLERKYLKLAGQNPPELEALLSRHGLKAGRYSVVHPGMGGSALNWPTDHYAALIDDLTLQETVAITGTAADEPYIAPLRDRFRHNPRVVWLDGKLKGPELISVLASARTVTAPSTGVLHLAASTGTPTLGIFSPVRVQHPKRWGPKGARVDTVMPSVDCPGELGCLGSECPAYPCMVKVTPENARQRLEDLAKSANRRE